MYISSYNGPDFSADKRLHRGVEIKFISENDLSTSAVDGGISVAISMIFVIPWCIAILPVHQSFFFKKIVFLFPVRLFFASFLQFWFWLGHFVIILFLLLHQLFFYLSQPRMNFDLIHTFLRQQFSLKISN